MKHRERVIAALNHEEPDRVPMDLGGTLASSIIGRAYTGLRRELHLPDLGTSEAQRYASLAVIDEDLRAALDVDIIHAPRAFGIGEHLKTVSESAFIDEWGVRWRKPEQGHYYVETPPFAKEATPRAVERFRWPEPEDITKIDGLADSIRKIRRETDYAISLELRGRTLSF